MTPLQPACEVSFPGLLRLCGVPVVCVGPRRPTADEMLGHSSWARGALDRARERWGKEIEAMLLWDGVAGTLSLWSCEGRVSTKGEG